MGITDPLFYIAIANAKELPNGAPNAREIKNSAKMLEDGVAGACSPQILQQVTAKALAAFEASQHHWQKRQGSPQRKSRARRRGKKSS